MNRPLFTVLLFCVFWVSSFAQVTFTITSIPENTPEDATIYAAGNFNSWNDGNADYALTAEADGTYTLTFEPAPGTLEFKFTRGSWATVEGNATGGYLPNRTLNYEGGTLEVDLEILSWEGDSPATSTAADNVFLLDEDFYMPQLDRNRRIWIYLPPDYNTSDATYPVLYMHDGQNLFDAATAAFGEWEVDESLNALFQDGDPGVIVVGIDNGGGLRLNEYSPWINPSYGGGEGAAYVDFIVETLKP
ncbi:MAG: alpha/beta hydrolase, partial [Mameliella sp.]|nr:alpha/beta hydrolase [Phaeodactylibacter sp.]